MKRLGIKLADGTWKYIPLSRGISTYEIAIKYGFIGTEAEWYDTLKNGGDWKYVEDEPENLLVYSEPIEGSDKSITYFDASKTTVVFDEYATNSIPTVSDLLTNISNKSLVNNLMKNIKTVLKHSSTLKSSNLVNNLNQAASGSVLDSSQGVSLNNSFKSTESAVNETIANLIDTHHYHENIYGVEVDFVNKTCTRIGESKNYTPGFHFDRLSMYGGRRKCIIADDGYLIAYSDGRGYTEEGFLKETFYVQDKVYEAGTPVQVMVEQPKFYYRIVPLDIAYDSSFFGFHINKARYYISEQELEGFKLHPAFIDASGNEVNRIYLSAYETCAFNTTTKTYAKDGTFPGIANTTFASIIGASPLTNVTLPNLQAIQKVGVYELGDWKLRDYKVHSVTQLLFLIEYASFDVKSNIGKGIIGNSTKVNTGLTTSLVNKTGKITTVEGYEAVTYRGEENLWGNISEYINGAEIFIPSDVFISRNDSLTDYEDSGLSFPTSSGYINTFSYHEKTDYLFIPSKSTTTSSTLLNDKVTKNSTIVNTNMITLGNVEGTGLFALNADIVKATTTSMIGARFVFYPKK